MPMEKFKKLAGVGCQTIPRYGLLNIASMVYPSSDEAKSMK